MTVVIVYKWMKKIIGKQDVWPCCTRTSISTVFRLMTLPWLISQAGWLSTQISHHVIFPLIAYFRQHVTEYDMALGMHSTEWATITFQNAASGLTLILWTLLQTLILWLHLPIQPSSSLGCFTDGYLTAGSPQFMHIYAMSHINIIGKLRYN